MSFDARRIGKSKGRVAFEDRVDATNAQAVGHPSVARHAEAMCIVHDGLETARIITNSIFGPKAPQSLVIQIYALIRVEEHHLLERDRIDLEIEKEEAESGK